MDYSMKFLLKSTDVGPYYENIEKEYLDFLKRISQKVANKWPCCLQKIVSEEEGLSEEFKVVLEEARKNLEIIRTTGRPHDQDMWCSHCHKMLPCRYRPSPEAGPYWRCSECGEVIGE
jgi:hypothetical protein